MFQYRFRVPILGLFGGRTGTVPVLEPFRFWNRTNFGTVRFWICSASCSQAIDFDLPSLSDASTGVPDEVLLFQAGYCGNDCLPVEVAELAKPVYRRMCAMVRIRTLRKAKQHQLLRRRSGLDPARPRLSVPAHRLAPMFRRSAAVFRLWHVPHSNCRLITLLVPPFDSGMICSISRFDDGLTRV